MAYSPERRAAVIARMLPPNSVQLTRLDFVSFKDRRAVATALKSIYRAIDADAAERALAEFEAGP